MDLPLPAAASADTTCSDPVPGRPGGCAQCAGPQAVGSTAAERAARDGQLLAELAEIGTDLARMIRQQANAAAWLGSDGPAMFERVARAVRQTIALRLRLEADALARQLRGAAEPAAREAGASRTRERRKTRVKRLVEAAIEADAGRRADPGDSERLLLDLHERLDDPDIAAELANRPIGEIVAGICRDLGITRDCSRWPDEPPWMAAAPDDRDAAALTPALAREALHGAPHGAGERVQPVAMPGGPPARQAPRIATGRDPP